MSRPLSLHLLAAALFLTTTGQSLAEGAAIEAESGPEKTALLELYTSEGCNSCPPADLYLSRIGASDLTPRHVIPLAFHVTYWDYIGWRDPFARKDHDQRQRAIAARAGSRTVYTPQLILNGRDMRGGGHLENQLRMINARTPAAHILLRIEPPAEEAVTVRVTTLIPDTKDRRDADLYIAVYENGLSRYVKAGENRGRTLHHDHVVRGLYGPYPVARKTQENEKALRIPLPDEIEAANAGIVAFVQNREDGGVLQAVSAPLP